MEIEGKILNQVYQECKRLVLLKIEGRQDLGYSCLSNSYQKQKKKKEVQPSIFKGYQLNLQIKLILDSGYFLDFVPSHLQLCLGSDLRLQQRDVTRSGLEKLLGMDQLGKFLNSLSLPLFSSSKKEIILPFLLYFLMSVNLLQWKLFLCPEKSNQDTSATQE